MNSRPNPLHPQGHPPVLPDQGGDTEKQNPQADSWLQIGKIVAPQGLTGELRIYPNSDFPERFEKPGQRFLKRPGETEPQPIKLLSGRYLSGKEIYVVRLEGVENRDQAEALRDSLLLVPASDRPKLGKDEYHVRDLIDLEVFNQLTGEAVGVVVDVIPAGNDLLEVQLHEQPEPPPEKPEAPVPNRTSKIRKLKRQTLNKPTTVLIPFVKAIAPVVDLESRRIEITPPPGLLESCRIEG